MMDKFISFLLQRVYKSKPIPSRVIETALNNTIGHKRNGSESGVVIHDNVKLYCSSSIIGEIEIGENVIIGAHVLVTKNVIPNSIITNRIELNPKLINSK